MKLLNTFKNIVDDISPEICWFTTFNLNVEILEKYVLTAIAGKEPSELKRAEDYEALNLDLNKLKVEVDKCVLVCANCHGEIHAGIIDINDYI